MSSAVTYSKHGGLKYGTYLRAVPFSRKGRFQERGEIFDEVLQKQFMKNFVFNCPVNKILRALVKLEKIWIKA